MESLRGSDKEFTVFIDDPIEAEDRAEDDDELDVEPGDEDALQAKDDEDAEDDEEEDQASLEDLLARRAAGRKAGEEADEEPDIMSLASEPDEPPAVEEPIPLRAAPVADQKEFVCSNCHLVKPKVQLADPKRGRCRDCV